MLGQAPALSPCALTGRPAACAASQVRCRQQKLGQSRAAIRSAMRAVVLRRNQSSVRRNAAASEAAAARAAAEVDGDEAAARGGKSVREKIQEERRGAHWGLMAMGRNRGAQLPGSFRTLVSLGLAAPC